VNSALSGSATSFETEEETAGRELEVPTDEVLEETLEEALTDEDTPAALSEALEENDALDELVGEDELLILSEQAVRLAKAIRTIQCFFIGAIMPQPPFVE
jgi:hypothetical protein